MTDLRPSRRGLFGFFGALLAAPRAIAAAFKPAPRRVLAYDPAAPAKMLYPAVRPLQRMPVGRRSAGARWTDATKPRTAA